MSNTRKTSDAKTTGPKIYSVDRYAREAALPPFELVVDDETTIKIAAPTGASLSLFAQAAASANTDAMLVALLGDAYADVTRIFNELGYSATIALLDDLTTHFKLDGGATEVTLVGPNGGKVSESDPAKIENLLGLGWRLGE